MEGGVKHYLILGFWLALSVVAAAGFQQFENSLIESSQQLEKVELQLTSAAKRAQVLEKDPYAAPLKQAEAADAIARARAQLKTIRLQLRKEAFRLWTDVLTSQARLEAARANEQVMEIRMRAVQIKAKREMASPLELSAAERAYERASLQRAQARAALEAARQALTARAETEPDEVPQIPLPKTLDLENHPDFLLAKLDVGVAERAVALASGPDTARLELEKRKAELQASQERAERLREQLKRQLKTLQAQYERQKRLVELARAAVEEAQKKLEAQRLRWDQGLASQLDLLSAKQALAQAYADEMAAKVELGRLALELWAYAEEQ